MANKEKQPIGVRARLTLAALALTGSLSGCDQNQPASAEAPRTPSLTPTTEIVNPTAKVEPSPIVSPTLSSTQTSEPTPAQEVLRIPGVVISEDYLKGAFAGIGGGETIEGGQQETTAIEFGQNYVSQSWGEEIDFTSLPEDPIASLKYLISLGAYQGDEGIFYPGKELFLPQIADLSLIRLPLENIPPGVDQKRGGGGWFSPEGLLVHPGIQMTVVGLLNEPLPEDANEIERELKFALVAFTDYLRVSEKSDVPSHYFALIPACLPADYREDKEALTLPNLLEVNGYDYNFQKKEITLAQNGQKTILELNQIEGEEFTNWFSPNSIRKACGLRFVDQIKGELIKNPVVPYPGKMPRYWAVERVRDENGQISFLMWDRKGPDTEQEDYEGFTQARYDSQKEKWVWGEVTLFEPTPVFTSEEEQQLKDIVTRIYESEEAVQFNLQLIFFNLEEAGKIDLEELEYESDSFLQYNHYTMAAMTMKTFYMGSLSGLPGLEKSDSEMLLKLLAKIRELARQNPHYDEKDWVIEGVDSY